MPIFPLVMVGITPTIARHPIVSGYALKGCTLKRHIFCIISFAFVS
jgi:hypothetical protein